MAATSPHAAAAASPAAGPQLVASSIFMHAGSRSRAASNGAQPICTGPRQNKYIARRDNS